MRISNQTKNDIEFANKTCTVLMQFWYNLDNLAKGPLYFQSSNQIQIDFILTNQENMYKFENCLALSQ